MAGNTPAGRDREHGLARLALDDALGGHGRIALVSGPAGIGKSTLVEGLAEEARAFDSVVLTGRCADFGTPPPYGPWIEVQRAYRDVCDQPWSERSWSDVDSAEALIAVVATSIRAAAGIQPLVIVFEDLHWSDPPSVDLLRSLAPQLTDARVLVVATYRADELDADHPLTRTVPALLRAGAARVDVRPLDIGAIRDIVAARYDLPAADRRRLVDEVAARSDGNPLYIRELLQTFEEQGILRRVGSGWELDDLTTVRLPALIRPLIDGRLARLEASTRELLQVAALIGADVPLDVWRTVAGAESTLDAAVEEALDAGVLEGSTAAHAVVFSHALVREALYEAVPLSRRRDLHRRVADAAAGTNRPDPDLMAYHLHQAGDDRAIEWLVRAGERAERTFALLEAAARFAAAAELLEGTAGAPA